MSKDSPSFVKVFAAPGIDSHPAEQGVFNSGAAFDPQAPTLKTPPYDWLNECPEQSDQPGSLIGNFPTQSKTANQLSVRKRGISPWHGSFPGGRQSLSMQHVGGIVDTNTGCSSLIAGGPGQASTMCRVTGGRSDRAMKLPILPQQVKRGGPIQFPAGGGSHDPLVAPLQPKTPGFVSIFAFKSGAKPA